MFKFIILIALISLSIQANIIAPKWFKQKTNTYIVYAHGNTLKHAKNNALEILKMKLNTKKISLKDFEIIKEEIFENQYFLKVKYINETISTQLINEIKKLSFKAEEQNSKQLINTKFFKNMYDSFSYYPNIELHDNYLYFKEKKFIIKQHELSNFVTSFKDQNITLEVKDIIKENENFFVELTSSYEGYSNLSVYFKNDFSILFSNKTSEEFIIYPDFKLSDGISLSLDNNKTQNLMFIISICKEKKDFKNYKSLYEIKSNKHLEYSDYANEINDCEISSKSISIEK